MSYFRIAIMSLLLVCLGLTSVEAGTSLSLAQATRIGEIFLSSQIRLNQYGVLCSSNSLQIPCPISDTGRMLTLYFMLNALDGNLSDDLRNKIISVVKSEQKNHLWGYSLASPPDADDTTFALQILTQLGEKENIDTLSMFYKPSLRSYTTFLSNQNAQLVSQPSFENNLGIHPEVNANIANLLWLLKLDAVINYDLISESQAKEGYWHSYFLVGKYYSTYLNMKLLCETKHKQKNVLRGIHFLESTQSKNGSWLNDPYDTALALDALLVCGRVGDTAVIEGINYLLQTQTKHGDWVGDKIVLSYLYQENPPITWSFYDNHHVLTTAFAIMALKKYSAEINKPSIIKHVQNTN